MALRTEHKPTDHGLPSRESTRRGWERRRLRVTLLWCAAMVLTLSQSATALTGADAHQSREHSGPRLLVTGLAGGSGSTVGPDGALYVPEPISGTITRVDPRTGKDLDVRRRLASHHTRARDGGRDGRSLPRPHGERARHPRGAGRRRDQRRWGSTGSREATRPALSPISAPARSTTRPRLPSSAPSGVQYALQAWRGGFLGHRRSPQPGARRVPRYRDNPPARGLRQRGSSPASTCAHQGKTGDLASSTGSWWPRQVPFRTIQLTGESSPFGPRSNTAEEVAEGASILTDVEALRRR